MARSSMTTRLGERPTTNVHSRSVACSSTACQPRPVTTETRDSPHGNAVMRTLGRACIALALALSLAGLVLVAGFPELEAYGILAMLGAVAILTNGVGVLAAAKG